MLFSFRLVDLQLSDWEGKQNEHGFHGLWLIIKQKLASVISDSEEWLTTVNKAVKKKMKPNKYYYLFKRTCRPSSWMIYRYSFPFKKMENTTTTSRLTLTVQARFLQHAKNLAFRRVLAHRPQSSSQIITCNKPSPISIKHDEAFFQFCQQVKNCP